MAASLRVNGQQNSSSQADEFQHEGLLYKRQRGRKLRRGSGRMKLKFQPRFCVLNNTGFLYYDKQRKSDKPKDIFPAERIKFVKDVAPDTFSEQSLSGIDVSSQHSLQFGDEMEVLYLIAPTEEEKKLWMYKLEQAAKFKGNVMLKTYHRGAYGSKKLEEWSCCGYCGMNQEGCFSVSDDSLVHPRRPTHIAKRSNTLSDELSKTITQADAKLELGRKSYSADYTSSMQQTKPPLTRSKPIYSLKEDDRDTSYVCLVRSYDQETETVLLTSEDSMMTNGHTKQTMTTGIEETLTHDNDDATPKKVYFSVDGNSEMNKTKSTTQPTDAQSISKEYYTEERPVFKNSLSSYNLSEPLTALKLHQQQQFISGNQMLYVWDKTAELTLTSSLKLAGQVHSLDTWNDFIAVGSSVVQVIKLNPIGDPTRILYIKGKNKLPHSDASSAHSPLLVSFVGDGGILASAAVGEDTVDIWDPPPTDSNSSKVVMKPTSRITVDDQNIVSLTASKESWIVAITDTNGHIKASVLDVKSSSPFRTFEIGEDHGISNIYACLTGMNLLVGYGETISILDTQTGRNLHSKTLVDQTISCLSGTKGEVLVGTTGGDVIAFSEDDLAQIDKFTNNTASVTAVAAEEDFSNVYIAYSNGNLKVLSTGDRVNDIPKRIQNEEEQALNFDCVLGQQLCSEGILTQRQIFHPLTQESLSYPFEENGVSIELPPEILEHPNPIFEAAFSPFGPVGTQFILPEKMIPVSSAVWLCVSPYEKFRSPATLELSHCFACNSSEDAKLLHFLKAEHKDIKQDEFGNLTITFEEVDPVQSEFLPKKQTGTLKDHHFCIYCLAAVSQEKEVLGKINYCLTILKPKYCHTKERTKIYCILHFDLKGCKKLVEEQTPKDYDTVTKYLQFTTGRFESALEIHLDKAAAENCGWAITIESEKKIFAEDVNFYNYRKVDYLEAACKTSDVNKPYPHAYPPRFVLEVSARYAKHHSTIDLTFTGARRDLYTQIQLEPLRCEDDLNELNGPRNPTGGDDTWRPTEQSSPLPFPNGNCGPETDIDVH